MGGESGGLTGGARVAVIGGGISGAAAAAALLHHARMRGRKLDVRLFTSPKPGPASFAPVLLTPECRTRLAGLGVRVPQSWRPLELRSVEVISGSRRARFDVPASGLWVLDGAGELSGRQRMAAELTEAAVDAGAHRVVRRVEQVERVAPVVGIGAASTARNAGELVVRAQGFGERFHAVVLATGADGTLGDRFFPGFTPAPTVGAVHARLRHGLLRSTRSLPGVRVLIAPLPGIELLYLTPCPDGVHAVAVGPEVSPADLCQAVMAAARDGHLAEGFEIAELAITRVAAGVGPRVTAAGQLAVGPAAFGHPLMFGISEALTSAARGATALLDAGDDARRLRRHYLDEGISELTHDAVAATAAVPWLRRAGPKAAEAFTRARADRGGRALGGGVLGLSSPCPDTLRARARWSGVGEVLKGLFLTAINPLPPSAVVPEPNLYYVVDDDPASREALTLFLEAQGASVVAFADELALFCAVARRPPAAILLDVVLNWVDGLRLCEGLKQHPLTSGTRVFVMSGLNRPHVRQRALEAGAEAFLAKPVSPQRLLQLLHLHHAAPASRGETTAQDRGAVIESGEIAS